jgi:hypothetical protein
LILCYDFQKWTIVSLSAVAVSLTIGLVIQYAHGQPCTYKDINGVCTEEANNYFSINIPDSWTYTEYSSTGMSQLLGGGVNEIHLTPSEFSDILLTRGDFRNAIEKLQDEDSLYAIFAQDTNYPIKNAPLESYVKYKIDLLGIQNITSQHYTSVGKEKAVRIDANESAFFGNTKTALYFFMHDKQPYQIIYLANAKNNEKYLPEFEQMVKSFKFR